jgi:hypothetical protein
LPKCAAQFVLRLFRTTITTTTITTIATSLATAAA